MKKIIAAACAAAILLSAGCSAFPNESSSVILKESVLPAAEDKAYTPINYKEQVGMWLPYVRFPEIMQGKSEEQFRKAIRELLQDAAAENVNTLYFHAHPMGDAYYRSEIFPHGTFLDGDYDPMQIVIDEAHKLGISVHGWINPLRLQTDDEMKMLPDDYIVRKWIDNGEPFVRNVNGRWFLSPSYPETVELIEAAVGELLENYNIDGVHIDDYFYPSTDEEFDRDAFEKSGSTDLVQWRTENVSRYVKAIYDKVKSFDKRLLFGISPQGNIDSDYTSQYADVRRWSSEEGFCDYIVPQLITHEITTPVRDHNYKVMLPITQGMTKEENPPEGIEIERLMVTSEQAVSKAEGFSMHSYDKEEGDEEGQFLIGVFYRQLF